MARQYFGKIFYLIVAMLATFSIADQANAVTPIKFKGGECTLVFQANAWRIDFCKNLTKVDVDDIHLTVSHPELPDVSVNYGQGFFCSFTGDCFGDAVKPGGNWEGVNGSLGDVANITLWGPGSLTGVDFGLKKVTITGNWTKGGKAVVPEPSSWVLLLIGFGTMGGAIRRSRHKLSAAGHD